MQWYKKAFSFYINSSIHVSLSVCALAAVTSLEYEFSTSYSLYFFIFFMTVTGYNFVKYAKVAGLHHRSLTNSLRSIQVFSAMALLGVLYFMFHLNMLTVLIVGAFSALTFLYAVPVFGTKNLRTVGGIKIIIVGLVWAGVTVIVPLVESKFDLSTDVWLTFVQRLFFVVTITLPFEIRDLKHDKHMLRTFPQRLGVLKTKVLGIIFLLCILVMEFFKDEISLSHIFSLSIISLIVILILLFSKKQQSVYFASFWVEGIPILWLVLMFAF